jgi:hypothetical protein
MAGRNNMAVEVKAGKKGSRRKFSHMTIRKLDDGSYHSMTHFEAPAARPGTMEMGEMHEPMEASHDTPQEASDHFFKMTGANRSNKTNVDPPKDTKGKNDGIAAEGTPGGKNAGDDDDVED